MPKIILTTVVFIILLFSIVYIIFFANILSTNMLSFFNISYSQRQSNFYVEIEVKEFLLKSEIEEIKLNSTSNYSIIIGEILLDTTSKEDIIFNFSGSIQKNNNEFSLIGRFSKANINKINITGKGKEIKILNKSFDQIFLKNFKINYIKFEIVNGKIKIPNIELNIENSTIEIFNAFANLTYDKKVKIDGICNQIKVNNKLLIASS